MKLIARRSILLLLSIVLASSAQLSGQPDSNGDTRNIQSGPADLNIAMLLDPTVRFELEEALKRKDYEKAEGILVREIENNPNAPTFELLTYLGGLFFVDKKYLNAAVAYKKAEAVEPLDPGNRFTLAMSYVLLGRSDWARPELDKLVEQVPEEPLYPYWMARLDYDANNYAQAVERLEALIAKFPSYVRAYDRLGLCFEALGKNEEALEQYRRAVDLNRVQDPQWVWPPLNLGVLQTQMGQFEDAEGSLQEAVKIDPGFAQAHYRHGLALEKLSRFEDAATALRKAAELDPEYPDPHWALARVLRRDGDREGAAAAVREYQRLKAAREQQ